MADCPLQLESAGGIPVKTMLGAVGTTVAWSDPEVPETGSQFLGQIKYATIHDQALSDSEVIQLSLDFSSESVTCDSHFQTRGVGLVYVICLVTCALII